MAVVTRYASGAKNPTITTQDRLPAEETQGHIKRLVSTIEAVNGDSANSKYYLGSIPANARLTGGCVIRADAIAGATDVDIGTEADPDCLMDGTDIHLGGSFSAVSAVDIANLNKPLWKLQAGVVTDPQAKLDVFLTLKAPLTAGGTLTAEIFFTLPD